MNMAAIAHDNFDNSEEILRENKSRFTLFPVYKDI